MAKVLLAVGLQEEKRKGSGKKFDDACYYYGIHAEKYDVAVNVVRVKQHINHNSSGKDENDIIDYKQSIVPSVRNGQIYKLHGFVLDDPSLLSMNNEYHIIGGSLGFAVMGLALQLYGAGYNVKVLEKYTFDRKGMEKEAKKLFNTYMPGVLV